MRQRSLAFVSIFGTISVIFFVCRHCVALSQQRTRPLWCGRPYLTSEQPQEPAKQLVNRKFVVKPGLIPYTANEQNGTLIVFVDPSFGSRVVFRADTSKFTVVNSVNISTSAFSTFHFDLTKFPLGVYTNVSSTIKSEEGTLLATTVTVIGRFPEKRNAVKIDNISGGLIVDGLPFVAVGFYYDWSRSEILNVVRSEVSTGFNSPLPYRPPLATQLKDVLSFFDTVANYGVKVILDLSGIVQTPNTPSKFGTITHIVNAFKDHTALLSYYIADEPDGPQQDPQWMIQPYNLIKKLDPYHPVTIVLNCQYGVNNYTAATDILMTDPYPIGLLRPVGCDYCKGEPKDVWQRVMVYKEQLRGAMPLWLVLQAFGGAEHWSRSPTPGEERTMTYLGLISGVRGFIYFLEGIPYARALWGECERLSLEIAELTPWLLSREVAPPATITFSATVSDNSVEVSRQHHLAMSPAMLLPQTFLYKNYIVVIVVNSGNSAAIFEVSLQGVAYSGNVTAIFETEREVFCKNGVIRDFIDGYGTRVYRFYYNSRSTDSSSSLHQSKHLHLSSQPQQNMNLIRNPSFEDCPNVGIPNGYDFWVGFNGSSVLVDSRVAIDGVHSARVTCADDTCASTDVNGFYRYYQIQASSITLYATTTYSLSFWAKGSADNIAIVLYNGFVLENAIKYSFTVSSQWRHFAIPNLNVPETADYYLRLLVTTPNATIWFDDFRVSPIEMSTLNKKMHKA
jgi:hypothetical protein